MSLYFQNRGWGVEINPDLYNKQKELWDQVSRRSSLSALSLASSVHKPITKEEKDAENNKKTSPIKGYGYGKTSNQVHFIDNKFVNDGVAVPGRPLNFRHHLGRTIGLGNYYIKMNDKNFNTCCFSFDTNIIKLSYFKIIYFFKSDTTDDALITSPTIDKLMPTIPRSRDDESYNSQRGSPKKSATSRHGSPQKGSPQKQSGPKKVIVKQTKGIFSMLSYLTVMSYEGTQSKIF